MPRAKASDQPRRRSQFKAGRGQRKGPEISAPFRVARGASAAAAGDYVYTKSTADQVAQLSAPANIDVTGYGRTAHGADIVEGLYVELEQTGLSVTGKFDITSRDSGTLSRTIRGTHLVGTIKDNSGYPPESFDFVFSADTRRFVGHYGTSGVWNGAND